MPRLEELPLQELPWERFEQLLRRMTRDVLGLRQVQLYGVRGQSQHGIDIVGRSADGTGEAIQSKKYETFTKADLTAAVTKFLASRSTIPFPVGQHRSGSRSAGRVSTCAATCPSPTSPE